MLDEISVAQWFEWKAWRAIRGPIGPERWDFYVSYLAMEMGAPYPRGEAKTVDEFRMPWQPEFAKEVNEDK